MTAPSFWSNMEEKFILAWKNARVAAQGLGVRLRAVEDGKALEIARRCLDGSRDSEGFAHLQRLGRLDLSLEALAVKKAYTALFTDEQVNNALMRLLDAGYIF